MKRYSRILIMATAAIITFGSLWAFAGGQCCSKHSSHHSCSHSSTTQTNNNK